MTPDPFSALLDALADSKEAASKLHADLVRGDKAEALLADLVAALNRLDSWFEIRDELYAARAFLAASPTAIPPGD